MQAESTAGLEEAPAPETAATPPQEQSESFYKDVRESVDERAHVRKLVHTGRWRMAEPNPERARAYNERLSRKRVQFGPEAIQGNTNDLQQVSYLIEGAQVRRAIGYVEVNDVRGSTVGSGFLISPRLFLTNRHVIRDETAARAAQITFDREMDLDVRYRAVTTFTLDPDAFALFSEEKELDYALVAVGRSTTGSAVLADLGYCALCDTPDRHVLGMNVNIIQHPNGLPKMIAIRNNILTARTERSLLYETDTETGSSGAPVFNDTWDLVALHHWGEPFLATQDESPEPLPLNVNEGVRISAIFKDLKRRRAELSPQRDALLVEALSYTSESAAASGPQLSGPRPDVAPGSEMLVITPQERRPPAMTPDNQFTFSVPLEITIRLGNQPTQTAEKTLATVTTAPVLKKGAEAIYVDEDYQNRSGYDPDFIPGVSIPLPKPDTKLAKQIAPLRATEPNSAGGELKYEHFSVKMNKSKRIAMFTATNIDGTTYLNVDRTTGLVTGPEGDKWFKDPRISEAFWTGQDFYSVWSNYFDRGHLTRRTDPTWGTNDEAERANADTFHWTNCSPQHFRFNEKAKYWQGAERYVLENGLLSADVRKPVSVFQGPIFDQKIDQWADDLQIPSSFFKVIVWKGAAALKAVGLVVDQLPLLSETRVNLGQPKDLTHVNVGQWRVAIKQIEKRTGLSFGDDVLGADTIGSVAQPGVGEEAAVPLTSLQDILR
jgi:endonuclease G